MSALDQLPGSASPVLAHQGLLPPALRRDLTDLNGLYLELGFCLGAEDDPRFAWPASVGKCLRELDAPTLARLGAGPFALFEICLLYTSPSPRDGLLSRMPSSA